MARLRVAVSVVCAAVLFSAAIGSAAAKDAVPPDPLRLVSPAAEFVLKVEKPRAIADLVVQLTSRPELEGFRGYRDYFGSTNYQLFRQLVAHFEQELGHSWPELLDQLSGGGIVVAAKFETKKPAPVLLVVQGTDAKLTGRFFRKLRDVITDEQARQGATHEYKAETYRGIETFHVGDNLYAAALDAALVYSNQPQTLHAAIDQHLDPTKPSLLGEKSFSEARPLVPSGSLAWAWVSLNYVHQSAGFKTLSQLPINFFPPHVLAGGLLDVLRRSPSIVAAVHQEQFGLALNVRMPRGTTGMGELVRAHVPPAGERGALPVLFPDGALFSTSYYLDLAEFWKQRAALLPPDQLKQAEEGDKRSGAVLQGTRVSQFLEYAGARQRIVVARQQNTGYGVKPETHYPAFGWILELREPEKFEKAIDGPLKGAAFLAGLQVPLTPIDETYGGAKITGYRFVESDANKARNAGLLFNFAPCRARVGNQFIVASTLDLMHKLIDAINKEAAGKELPTTAAAAKRTAASPASGATIMQSRLAWSGISSYLGGIKKQLVTQNMLQQGNSPADAAKEVSLFLDMLDHLGRIEASTRIEPDQYQFDLRILPF